MDRLFSLNPNQRNPHPVLQLKVILTSVVTYATLAATILGILSTEFAASQFSGLLEPVVAALGVAVSVLLLAITVIRQVTPVLPSERGLLPVE